MADVRNVPTQRVMENIGLRYEGTLRKDRTTRGERINEMWFGVLFIEGQALLNTSGMLVLNLDWANRSAATPACVACGRVEWFVADPDERA
jgi:hypothetical protein